MKTIKKIMAQVSGAVLMAGLALNFNACTQTDSPLTPQGQSLSSQSGLNFMPLGDGTPRLNKIVQVSKFVTYKDGGELILDYKGNEHNDGAVEVKITLKVFSETISEDAKLALSLDDQTLTGNVDVTFSPHGITFSQPALLGIEAKNLDLANVDPSLINCYYDNQETGRWEIMESYDIIVKQDEGYIKIIDAELPHFSRYAVAWSN